MKCARWLATRQGRGEAIAAYVQTALKECVIPIDAALAVSLWQNRRDAYAPTSRATRETAPRNFTRAGARASGLVTNL